MLFQMLKVKCLTLALTPSLSPRRGGDIGDVCLLYGCLRIPVAISFAESGNVFSLSWGRGQG